MLPLKTIVFVSVVLCCLQEEQVLCDWFEDMMDCYQNSTPCCGRMCICTEECVMYGHVCRCRSKNVVLFDEMPTTALVPSHETAVREDEGKSGF